MGESADRLRLHEHCQGNRRGAEAADPRVVHDPKRVLAGVGPERVRRVGERVDVKSAGQGHEHRDGDPAGEKRRQRPLETRCRQPAKHADPGADDREEHRTAGDVGRVEREPAGNGQPGQERHGRNRRPHASGRHR